MNFKPYISNTNQPPRLEIQQAWWAMTDLGNGAREWTLEEKFEKIAEAGFKGILGALPTPEEAKQWRALLDRYKFSFGITAFPAQAADLRPLLAQAQDFGVQYLNAQVLDNFVIDAAAIALLTELLDEAAQADFPVFIETHRGRITQDLHRTVAYVEALPDLRLTLDLSHYVLAGEMYRYSKKAEALFEVLLSRTASLHARVSNGEQVQVDVGPNGEHRMLEHFRRWWQKGMTYWRAQAQPGEVLPFVCELGPAGYAITHQPYLNPPGPEISDRWQQSLLFKRIAEEIWQVVDSSPSQGTQAIILV